jgi:hypothetical protein
MLNGGLRRIGGIAVVVVTVSVDHKRIAQSVEVAAVFCVVDVVLEKILKNDSEMFTNGVRLKVKRDDLLLSF